METQNLGKIIPTAAGDWNSSTTYEKLTTIWHAPSLCAYISKTINRNKQPNLNPSDWQKITDVSSAYNYALDKGNYAKDQGDYAKDQADRNLVLTNGLTTNYISKWNGIKFVDSPFYNLDGKIGIGITDFSSFPGGKLIVRQSNTTHTYTGNIGISGEATANTGETATGTGGTARTFGTQQGRGVAGVGKVSSTSDTGAAIGGYFRSIDTHNGGVNAGASFLASGSSVGNYAISLAGGDISSSTNALKWLLYDNNTSSLSFDTGSKSGLLKFNTTKTSESISTSGNFGIGVSDPSEPIEVIGIKEYEDNEEAIGNGLEEGAFYRTGDILKIVHK